MKENLYDITKIIKTVRAKKVIESALHGLDFLVRHQVTNTMDANCGRFVSHFDCTKLKVHSYTTSWTTGVCAEAMLIGHKLTGKQIYLDAAQSAVKYIASLQYIGSCRMNGVIREETPQTLWAHPRDALTAAWAMLDFSQYTKQEEYFERSLLYAKWFLDVALEKGYPYWTVRLDEELWSPQWFGSFQSGGAFYFFRLFDITGEVKYKKAAFQIIDYYNRYHLEGDGHINVTVDMETLKPIKGHKVSPKHSCLGWEIMHEYNDDFAVLANLAAYKVSRQKEYLEKAECFLQKMISIQRVDGGFGPEEYSVPSAGGSVLLELLAARQYGLSIGSSEQIDSAVKYLLNLQITDSQSSAHGAFRGFNNDYKISEIANARTISYSIMALLRYAGVVDSIYFFDSQKDVEILSCPDVSKSLVERSVLS